MPSIKLLINVERETLYPGAPSGVRKRSVYKASIGALKASGDTEIQARAELDRLVRRAVSIENQIVTLFDMFEPECVWIAVGDAHGWSYRIVRRQHVEGYGHFTRETMIGGTWTREECLDHMRDHWYSNNFGRVVEGICALAGWGRAECKKCRTVTRLEHMPERCQNPACGATL